eukprot:6129881-Alexandrium_andersonii.AAC.1
MAQARGRTHRPTQVGELRVAHFGGGWRDFMLLSSSSYHIAIANLSPSSSSPHHRHQPHRRVTIVMPSSSSSPHHRHQQHRVTLTIVPPTSSSPHHCVTLILSLHIHMFS